MPTASDTTDDEFEGEEGNEDPPFEPVETPAVNAPRAASGIQWSADPTQRRAQVQTEIARRRSSSQGDPQSVDSLLTGTRLDPRGTQAHQEAQVHQQANEEFQYQRATARAEEVARRREALTQTREANSKTLADYMTRGVKHYRDPASGLITPITDADGHEQFTTTTYSPSTNPATGLPSLARRNEKGEMEHRLPPLKLNAADPRDEYLYADFSAHGIPDSPKAMKIADAAQSDDMKLRALGVQGLARQRGVVRQEARLKAVNEKRVVDLEVQAAHNEAEQIGSELADTAKVSRMDPAALAAKQSRQTELQEAVKPGGALHMKQKNAEYGYNVARATLDRDAYADQEKTILARLTAEGVEDPETDPTYQENHAKLEQNNAALGEATQQQAKYAALMAPKIQAQAEVLRKNGAAGGGANPSAVLKLQKQSSDIAATIAGAGTNVEPRVIDRLTEQKKLIDSRATEEFAKLPADQQKRVTDLTRDPTIGERVKDAAGAATGAFNTGLIDAGAGVARALTTPGALGEGARRVIDTGAAGLKKTFAGGAGSDVPEVQAKLDESIPHTLAQTAGGMASVVAPGTALGKVGKIAGLSDHAASLLSRLGMVATGGAQGGEGLRREAINTLAPSLRSGKITRDEYERGVGLATLTGDAIGAAGFATFPQFASRIAGLPAGKTLLDGLLSKAARGGASATTKWLAGEGGRKAVAEVLREGAQAGGVGFAQTLANDLAAKEIFDPSREIDPLKATKSAAEMGVVGALASALTHVSLPSRGAEPAGNETTAPTPSTPGAPDAAARFEAAANEAENPKGGATAPFAVRGEPSTTAEAESKLQGDKEQAAESFAQNASDVKARHDDISARRDAIEQQLTEAERLRQSNAGGAELKNDLAARATGEPPPEEPAPETPPAPVEPVDSGPRDESVSTGNGVPTEKEKAMLAEQKGMIDEAAPVQPRREDFNSAEEFQAARTKFVRGKQAKPAPAEKPTPPDAAPVSKDTPAPTAESVEGEKLSRGWTAFSPETGSLGIPRDEMPQVKSEARGALVNFLNARGITTKKTMVMPDQLRPTQAEFSPEKVQAARERTGADRPILISSDGHVVDGHHQWLAALDDTTTPLPVIRLNAPIDKVLAEMKEFPSSEASKGASLVADSRKAESTPAASPKLSERAIEALQKAKKDFVDPRSTVGGGLTGTALAAKNTYIAARNAAIDLAILAIRAGRQVGEVLKMATDRFRAKFPDHTPEDLKQFNDEMVMHVQQSPMQQSGPAAPATTGIAHRVSESRGVETERGEGVSVPDSIARGRELIAKGFNANKAISDFDKSGTISSDAMAAVRAHEEVLSRAVNKAQDEFGTDSPQAKAAWDEVKNWIDKIKPMQTEWHKIGQAQQGETEIDTGTFHGLQKAVYEATGRDMTPKEAGEAKEIVTKVKDTTGAADAAKEKVMKNVGLPTKTTDASIKAAGDVIKSVAPGTEWTPVQARALWHVAKANYIDRGRADFNDIRAGLATDFGLSKDDIARGMASPKGVRPLTNEMYAKMAESRRVINQAKQWVADTKYPGYQKFFRNIPNAFFNLATFGHGTVWTITHAGNQYFLPKASGQLFKDLGRSFKLMGVTDGGAYHERMMQDLVRDPNYITAKRAGLAVDPFRYQDDYQNAGVVKLFKSIGLMGNRGFDGMKLFRQFRFNQEWGAMPESLRTPEGAKLISDNINKATGITKASNLPAWTNTAFFAPKLEMSRWAFLYGDPVKDVKTLTLDRKTASPEERHAAVRDIRQKLTMAGVYMGALALNQAALSATGSTQNINFANPRSGDWLSFKGFGHNFGVVSPMVNSVRFLQNIAHDFWGERSKLEQVQGTRGSEAGTRAFEYARGKLSPFAGVALDAASQSDSVGRPMPYSNDPLSYRAKELGAKDKYSYSEYGTKKLLPIPLEEAATEIWRSQGATEDQIGKWMRAIAIGASAGGTGVRVTPQSPDYQPKGSRGKPQDRSTTPVQFAAPR